MIDLIEKLSMCGKKHRKVKPTGALLSKLGPIKKTAGKAEVLTGKDWENRKKKMKYKGVGPEWLGMGYYKNKKKGKKPMKKEASAMTFYEAFVNEMDKIAARVYMREGKGGLGGRTFGAKGPKDKVRSYVNYVPGTSEKHIYDQPGHRRGIADIIRTLKKDPKAGRGILQSPAGQRKVPLNAEQTIKVLRKRGKHFAKTNRK